MENDLPKQKTFTEKLIENSAAATFVLDSHHKVIFWNRACEALTGISAAEMIGTSNQWRAFYDHERPCLCDIVLNARGDGLQELYDSYAKSTLIPDGLHAEGWYKNLNGRDRYILFDAAPVYDESGNILAVIETLNDATEQKRLEEKFRQSVKMESIGRLAGGVAHDFNNKLAVILGYAEVCKMHTPEGGKLWLNLNEIIKAAEHSRDVTSQLLSFSRQHVINPKPLNLNISIQDLQKSLAQLVGEDVRIKYNLTDNLLMVRIDAAQVDNIIINLALNGKAAMPDGGELQISTAMKDVDAGYCLQQADALPGSYIQLTVSDNGVGMSRETLTHLFEPFFTTRDVNKGAGLGLATIYGIVRQNNGFIEVESEVGNGTEFKVYLPVFHETADKVPERI